MHRNAFVLSQGIDIDSSVDDDAAVIEPRCDVTACNATIGGRCSDLREVRVDGTVTVGILAAADSGGGGGGQDVTDPAVGQPVPPPPLPLTPPLQGATKTPPPTPSPPPQPPPTPLQDATMTLPHTACFDIDGCNSGRLQDLTVSRPRQQ